MERNAIVQLGIDTYKGKPAGNYSVSDAQEVLRQEFITLNGGSTKLDFRNLREGAANGMYRIIEDILTVTVNDGLKGSEFFMNLVDDRNIAEGDLNEFTTPEKALFYVANTARGTQGIRRQRLNAGTTVSVPTKMRFIKIYEEITRLLSKRIDFNEMIDRVSRSFTKQTLDDIYGCITGLANGTTYFPTAGSYSEANLLSLIDHVEADTGQKATIFGTRSALRNLAMTNIADSAKEEQYNLGYFGKFFGTNVVCVPQVHAANTSTFKLNDKEIFVIAGDEKPIKFVTEGQGIVKITDPLDNADMTQEFLFGQAYGVALITANNNIGVYTLS